MSYDQFTADLVAENARLRLELADALDCKAGKGPTALSWAIAERDALRAEVDGLRADAERWRFFESRFNTPMHRHALARFFGVEDGHFEPSLSAAIDAAIAARGEG